MFMGEPRDVAQKSWIHMCKDMDKDKNGSIDVEEWLEFYRKSLAGASLEKAIPYLKNLRDQIKAEADKHAAAAAEEQAK